MQSRVRLEISALCGCCDEYGKTYDGLPQPATVLGWLYAAHTPDFIPPVHVNIWSGASDTVLAQVAQHCPRLQCIHVSGLSTCRLSTWSTSTAPVTDAGVQAIAHHCPSLQYFNITGCDRVTNDGVAAIAHGCPLLRFCRLQYCDGITCAGVMEVVRRCHSLEYLDISRRTGLTAQEIRDVRTIRPDLYLFCDD